MIIINRTYIEEAERFHFYWKNCGYGGSGGISYLAVQNEGQDFNSDNSISRSTSFSETSSTDSLDEDNEIALITGSFYNVEEEDEEEEERIQRILCHEAKMACRRIVAEHLFDFLAEQGEKTSASHMKLRNSRRRYEDWIKALHPENVEGAALDHRFYVQESDHRKVWNEQMKIDGRADLMVQPRYHN